MSKGKAILISAGTVLLAVAAVVVLILVIGYPTMPCNVPRSHSPLTINSGDLLCRNTGGFANKVVAADFIAAGQWTNRDECPSGLSESQGIHGGKHEKCHSCCWAAKQIIKSNDKYRLRSCEEANPGRPECRRDVRYNLELVNYSSSSCSYAATRTCGG